MSWLTENLYKFYGNGFLLLLAAFRLSIAGGQCVFGDGIPCTWENDGSALLKWEHKLGIDGHFIELTKCKYPECGVAIAVSPWLQPSDADRVVSLQYKVYGYSSVYLTVHFLSIDNPQPRLLSSVYGNYAEGFPTAWSSMSFTIPSSSSRYRLMIKANTPYREAYVAVKGISLAGTSPASNRFPTRSTSTPGPTSRPAETPINEDNSRNEEDNFEYNINEIDDVDEDYDSQFNELETSQALEDGQFYYGDDFSIGRTTIVYPNLCKYR